MKALNYCGHLMKKILLRGSFIEISLISLRKLILNEIKQTFSRKLLRLSLEKVSWCSRAAPSWLPGMTLIQPFDALLGEKATHAVSTS